MNPSKILIADDSEGVRRVLAQCLRADGRSVLTAGDGDEALALARLHLPDLIILDVRMPGRDGHEVCAELRGGEGTRGIPVLILSGLPELDAEYRGIGCGASGRLAKPFKLDELRERVASLLAAGA